MGIIAGLGRGMPGRPGRHRHGRPADAADGLVAGAPAAPERPGRRSRAGAGLRPMPWLGANGLLPGRGVPPGLPTGRGARSLRAWPRRRAPRARPAARSRRGPRRPAPRQQRPSSGPGSRAGAAARRAALSATGSATGGRRGSAAGLPGPRRELDGLGGSGLLGRRLGAGLAAGAAAGAAGASAFSLSPYLLAETHLRGQLDGRARRLDELPHLLELLENELALDAELFGEFVNSGLSHASPSGLRPGSSSCAGG